MILGDTVAAPRFLANKLFLFLILAFALSWYPWALALLRHTTSGPNPLGLLVAALIVLALNSGWRGPRHLLLAIVRVRVPLMSWFAVFLIPIGIVAVALGVAPLFGIGIRMQSPSWSDLFDRFVFTLLFVAFGEEPAWRGFLLPLLQRRLSPVLATVIVALIWAIWHLPLWGSEFAWTIVPAFLVSLLGGAFVLSWLYNVSRGSVLMPMLMHTTLNTVSAGYAFHLIGKSDLLKFWCLYAGLWLVAGTIAVLATRGRLGFAADGEAGSK
jgi:membrane protease YdiL (CAAX protease family)